MTVTGSEQQTDQFDALARRAQSGAAQPCHRFLTRIATRAHH
jgi:hypothetical protein